MGGNNGYYKTIRIYGIIAIRLVTIIPAFIAHKDNGYTVKYIKEKVVTRTKPETPLKIPIYCALMNIESSFKTISSPPFLTDFLVDARRTIIRI
ncbi:unnamed protein product [marine sediment metagenome]|uniref:Uncharacterized protein n=1 Tax=marine sediment metagenome TaxID=412755 RepID=X1REW7_9ZZZZ